MDETPIAIYTISKRGNRGLFVSIPMLWVRELGLKAGDEVVITRMPGKKWIKINPPGTFKLGGKKR